MFEQRKHKTLEKRRMEALGDIRGERLAFETMVQRSQRAGENSDETFLTSVRQRLAEIEQKAINEADIDELDDLGEDAEQQGQLRAYICPRAEIRNAGILAIDLMEEWNIPEATIAKLRRSIEPQLQNADTHPDEGRGALRDVFEEQDSWRRYTGEYEDEMRRLTWWLFCTSIGLLLFSIIALHFFSGRVPLGLSILSAGAAGSGVSIMRKMPLLEIGLSGELESYRRRIWSRIGVGVAASIIGSGFLGWGLLSVSIHGLAFADVLTQISIFSVNYQFDKMQRKL